MKIISVLEINLQNIAKNLMYFKDKLNSNQKICFVVKSNCYGFGAKLCGYFDKYVDYFAVSCFYEFKKIKKYILKPVLVLDPIYDKNEIRKLVNNDCELTISNFDSLKCLIDVCGENNLTAKIHIALNTGMNRFGFYDKDEILKLIDILQKLQNIEVKGIFSHYYQAKNNNIADFQLNRFKYIISYFENKFKNFPQIHICATDGVLSCNFGDIARIGYGLYSDEIYNTITLKTKILDLQHLNIGESAGYNGCFVAKKNCKIAVIGIGYGDGIFRNIVKNGYVIISDSFAKIVAVCMDSMLVDVTDIKCKSNDDVIILGKMGRSSISICDMARWCDTIEYEIIVKISERVKKVYRGENKCKLFLEGLEQEN